MEQQLIKERMRMKVLIINGSPRSNGDTVYVLESLKNKFPGGTVFEFLNAYESNIQPCNDCRYCWKNEGCSIRDEMDILWRDDYDVLILASPLYMSFVTPPLFSIISRLNAIWSNHYFLKTPKRLKPKKGVLILTGGGDGSPNPAINIAQTAFQFLNAQFDPALDYIRSLNTNKVSVQDDRDLVGQIGKTIKHIMGEY
jgi:multimeric flavodoxin WrbA